jgi:hypothetical protein
VPRRSGIGRHSRLILNANQADASRNGDGGNIVSRCPRFARLPRFVARGASGAAALILAVLLAAPSQSAQRTVRPPLRRALPNPAATAIAGWQAQRFAGVRAITSVRLTTTRSHSGRRSLALVVNLNGRVASLRQGEAFVDMRSHPPAGVTAPCDLSGNTISAWLYAPPGLPGLAHNPNGARLLVKDAKWRSEYGTWTHLRPGAWNRLTLTPAAKAPQSGFLTPDFDPHQVIVIGVSIAAGGGSAARFRGEADLDDVAWGPGAAPRYDFEP